MADFKYDSYDVSSMKVAFEHLRQTQEKGFWYGVIFGIPAGLLWNRALQKQIKLPIPFILNAVVPTFAGSMIYGLYTWSARADYAATASKVNRKYSRIINKIINY